MYNGNYNCLFACADTFVSHHPVAIQRHYSLRGDLCCVRSWLHVYVTHTFLSHFLFTLQLCVCRWRTGARLRDFSCVTTHNSKPIFKTKIIFFPTKVVFFNSNSFKREFAVLLAHGHTQMWTRPGVMATRKESGKPSLTAGRASARTFS